MRRAFAYVVLIGLLGAARAEAQLPHGIVDVCSSPTISSVDNGAWSSASTWNPARVPQAGDKVRVAHAVSYASVSDIVMDCVGITGSLTFSTSANTRLVVGTLYVYAAGALTIGTAASPVQSNRLAELVIADQPINTAIDPEQYTTAVLGFGKVEMHGAVKSPTFVRLTAERNATHTTLPIASTVSGWQAGDKLMVPGTQQWFPDSHNWPEEYETPTLSSVAGTTLTTSPLQFGHRGARDGNGVLEFLPHVGNLTRNVAVRSANPNGVRGHVLFTGRADIDIRYALFKDLGRTTIAPLGPSNIKGRYALHLHHLIGPSTVPANGYEYTLIGNAIENATKWGITIHNTHHGLVADNVIYNAQGAGVMTEDGNESFNLIERNFVVRVWGTGEERGDQRNIWLDSGFEGAAFWFRGTNNYVRDNVAANTNSFAWAIYPLDLGPIRVPKFKGADVAVEGQYDTIHGQKTPLREFARNEVYAAANGLTIWDVMADCCTQVYEGPESIVKDMKLWHLGRYGYYGYGHNRLTFDGWIQRGETHLLWSGFVQNRGIWFGDYPTRNQLIKRADIQGLRIGIVVPFKPGDTSDIYGNQPGVTRIEDSFVRAQYGIVAQPMYAVTGGGWSLPPRKVYVDRVRWQPINASVAGDIQVGLAKSYSIDTRNANIVQQDEFIVTDWQNVASDDFSLFYYAQAPAFVVPVSDSAVTGAPVEGETNAQLMTSHGLAIAGAIATCGTTRVGIEGFVCPSGGTPVIPAAPTNAVLVTP